MFQNVSFQRKILLLPALAAIGFLVVFALVRLEGRDNEAVTDRIESSYFPALNLSRDLESTLTEIERKLEDAAGMVAVEMLAATEAPRDRFLALVETGKSNSLFDAGQLDVLAGEFQSYYQAARSATERQIQEGASENLLPDLGTSRKAQERLQNRIDALTVRQTNEMKVTFQSARDNSREAILRISLVIGVCLVLLVLLSLLLSQTMSKPLRAAVRFADRLAEGDLEAKLEINSRDEVGQLGQSLNQMVGYLREMAGVADAVAAGDLTHEVIPRSDHDVFGGALGKMGSNLRRMLGELKNASSQVRSSAEQIAGSTEGITGGAENQSSATEETSSTMVEIASQIDSVARSTQSLATNVEQTSSSIQEMSASIDEVARNSDSLLSAVEETSATIEEMTASIHSIAGKVRVVDTVSTEAAAAAREGGQQLSETISGIDASAQNIGKIVRIIDEIADQTNLLALNAAIEAARAGDAGRGFAVVADEVKRLAERSTDSTQEIGKLVDSVQADTQSAVALADRILQQIVDSVTKTTALVAEVATATQEQSQGAAQIVNTSTNMQQTTRQLAYAAKEQAASAREILRAVESMNDMTQQVAEAGLEQKRGGDMVVRAVEQIAEIAHQNLMGAEQLSQTTTSLVDEAEKLQQIADVFTV